MISIVEAAIFLNVHEDYVKILIRDGKLPEFASGIPAIEVIRYKLVRDAKRNDALDELVRISKELDPSY